MQSLELQLLKGNLTGDELAAASAKIAEQTCKMTDAEKQAFLDGLGLAVSCISTQPHLPTIIRMLSALIVATHESLN